MAQFIYGKNVIITRIKKNNDVEVLYLTKTVKEQLNINLRDIKYEIMSKQQLDKLINHSHHQGIVAKIKQYEYFPFQKLLSNLNMEENPILLMLDGISDPHNLGAILRTCDAIGVSGVIVGKNNSAPLNATVAKTSVGAIETVKVSQVTNLTNTLKVLKQKGFWIVATSANESVDYRSVDYKMPLVIVVGSEGKGISKIVKDNSDFKVKIPMIGQINSLNVSVATAILLYEVYNDKFPL